MFKELQKGLWAGERWMAQQRPEIRKKDRARWVQPAAKVGALALCLKGKEDPVKSFNWELT